MKADVILDSFFFQTSKCFVAQTVAPNEIPSSHKKIVSMRSSKLDPMLMCSNNFFWDQKLPHPGYVSYHVCHTQVIVSFTEKFSWVCFQQTFIAGSKGDYDVCSELSALLCILSCCGKIIGVCFSTIFIS